MSERLTKTLRSALLDLGQRDNALDALIKADPHRLRIVVEGEKQDEQEKVQRSRDDERRFMAEIRSRQWERVAASLGYYNPYPMGIGPRKGDDVRQEILFVLDTYYSTDWWRHSLFGRKPLLLADLVEYLQPIPRTTVTRYLKALVDEGIAERSGDQYGRNTVLLKQSGFQRYRASKEYAS
jgi:hypothetical protein